MADTPKTPAGLTLQQKFVKLREAIPAIAQKAHSDGVKYKFAKIFDVYELLTPAMNQFGVNFDIMAEYATRHDANGDDLYYHSYEQVTRNGKRTVWVYEADLVVRWINADDPKDFLEVTLHAIGTNDSGPDKAKGSALTYCLKYYFFEKFGIDQGEDDPDMKDNSGNVTPQPQYQAAGARNSSGGTNTRPREENTNTRGNNAQGGLSDAQLDRMYAKARAAGFTMDQIDSRIDHKYGLSNPRHLTREQYDEICNALDAAKTPTEGENSNA